MSTDYKLVAVGGGEGCIPLDTDSTMAADSDKRVSSQKAVKEAIATALSGANPTELEFLDGATAGTQVASKAVIADANINIGATKVTALHIGATGAETEVTATGAELNYNDIASLGTGAASKAVVLDAGEDYVWPPTGILTYGVLKDPAGTTVAATGAQLNSLRRNPGTMAMAYIDFNGTGEAAMSVTIDGVVYQEADAEDLPNGVWTNGASAADSATSLIAAINGDTRAAVPFTAVADTSGDGVMLFWDAVGTAGNVTISTTSASNCTVQNSTGGSAAAIKQTCTIVHTVNSQELLSGAFEIPVPFTPTHININAFDSSGTPIYFTDLVTIGTSPARVKITTNGATNLANTNVVHLTVTE